jgi:hypothetical protein
MHDPEQTVREQVGQCFEAARPDQIEHLKPLINLLLNSPALLEAARPLIEYLRPIVADQPELALQVTERIVGVAGQQILGFDSPFTMIDRELTQLPLTVYTHTDDETIRSRAMDLFERLLLLGSYSAQTALQDYDRR